MTTNADEIKNFLRECISSLLDMPPEQLTDGKPLADLYDSVKLVTLMVEIEAQFSVNYEVHELLPETFGSIDIITEEIIKKQSIQVGGSS